MSDTSIEKLLSEEFYRDIDFLAIANALGLEIDNVAWSLVTGTTTHTLTGVAK